MPRRRYEAIGNSDNQLGATIDRRARAYYKNVSRDLDVHLVHTRDHKALAPLAHVAGNRTSVIIGR